MRRRSRLRPSVVSRHGLDVTGLYTRLRAGVWPFDGVLAAAAGEAELAPVADGRVGETATSGSGDARLGERACAFVVAREATSLEHDRILSELKREVGRLVVDTTAKVTGKVLTADDQKRLSEEAARQVAA